MQFSFNLKEDDPYNSLNDLFININKNYDKEENENGEKSESNKNNRK